MQPPTPLHHLLFPPRGTLTPFRRRLPPVSPAPFLPVVTALPPMASPAQQRQPIDDPVEGGDRAVRIHTRGGTRARTIHIRELENHRKNTPAKAGLPVFRRGAVAPGRRRRRVPPSFSSPPRGLCREYMQFSLALSRVALLRCTLRFQPRPTRREIGNLKSKLRTAACRAHPRPSFSRITLDHRWSSRAWYQTRGCVIELGK